MNSKGFTLIEIIAVLVILSVITSIAVNKYIDVSDVANYRALEAGVESLNTREVEAWVKKKFGPGWLNDGEVFALVDYDLGGQYSWAVGPAATGGQLTFNETTLPVTRTVSTTETWGRWSL